MRLIAEVYNLDLQSPLGRLIILLAMIGVVTAVLLLIELVRYVKRSIKPQIPASASNSQ